VIVRRPTEYDELMDRYSTRGQVEFVLRSRGRSLEEVERAHECHLAALARVRAGGRAASGSFPQIIPCLLHGLWAGLHHTLRL